MRTRLSKFSSKLRKALPVVLYAAIVLLSFAITKFVDSLIGYIPFFTSIILLFASIIDLCFLRKGISVEAGLGTKGCVRGQRVDFEMIVKNDSPLPATNVKVTFSASNKDGVLLGESKRVITMAPKSEKSFPFTMLFEHIGQYEVKIREVEISDFLGMFSFRRDDFEGQTVFVEPRLHEVSSLNVANEMTVESKKPITSVLNDGMDYFGVREYVWGDPIKSIHWKLSARSENYVTRVYEIAVNSGIEIIMDYDSFDYSEGELMSINDALVEVAFSLDMYSVQNGMDCEIVYSEDGDSFRMTAASQKALGSKVAQMPTVKTGNGFAALDIMKMESASSYSPSNIAICSSNITEELVSAVISIRSSRKNPILFALVPKGVDDKVMHEIKRRLSALDRAGIAYSLLSEPEMLESAA